MRSSPSKRVDNGASNALPQRRYFLFLLFFAPVLPECPAFLAGLGAGFGGLAGLEGLAEETAACLISAFAALLFSGPAGDAVFAAAGELAATTAFVPFAPGLAAGWPAAA